MYKIPTLNIKKQVDKVNRWRKIPHANANQNKVGVTILISDTADFRGRKFI